MKTAPPQVLVTAPQPRWARWYPLFLAAACFLAYSNSFAGKFFFDDHRAILANPGVRSMFPSFTGRPVAYLTMSLNFALSGLNVADYHAVNLLIHVLAALALYGLARRTLGLLAPDAAGGFTPSALALAIAMLWALHPLQTQSVTYIVQRAESLAGLFYLLTLYAVLRGATSVRADRWQTAAVVFCALGMGTKQTMVTAPVVVFLFDRAFLAGSFAGALRARWRLYLGLAATWLVVSLLRMGTVQAALGAPSAGFGYKGITPVAYALTQFGVITRYLRLALWPDALCFDYGWAPATTLGRIAPPALFVGALGVLALWALWRHPRWGFPGAWFFATLAPSSSFVPVADLAVEHRMYLALAGVAALAVAGTGTALVRLLRGVGRAARLRTVLGAALFAGVAAALGGRTYLRNEDYRSELRMWSDVVVKRPGNLRARGELARGLDAEAGRSEEAIAAYQALIRDIRAGPAATGAEETGAAAGLDARAVRTYVLANANVGLLLSKAGRLDEARRHYEAALRAGPGCPGVRTNLGFLLAHEGRIDEALRLWREELRLNPGDAVTHLYVGRACLEKGQAAEAAAEFGKALARMPDMAVAQYSLAWLRATCAEDSVRNGMEAMALARKLLDATDRTSAAAWDLMAAALAENGRFEQAVAACETGLRLLDTAGPGPDPEAEGSRTRLRKGIRERLDLYRAGRPYREAPVARMTLDDSLLNRPLTMDN